VLILGFGGKPGSGKTTAADAIKASFAGVVVYSISDLICAELGVKREEVKDARVLQDHGTRQRAKDKLHYTRQIVQQIAKDSPRIAVISNVRMVTEVVGVRALQGHLIRCTCFNIDGSEYSKNDRDMKHALETELDGFNWDHYITAKRGESRLVRMQTVTLVRYLLDRERKRATKSGR
jgi:AAA domain